MTRAARGARGRPRGRHSGHARVITLARAHSGKIAVHFAGVDGVIVSKGTVSADFPIENGKLCEAVILHIDITRPARHPHGLRVYSVGKRQTVERGWPPAGKTATGPLRIDPARDRSSELEG